MQEILACKALVFAWAEPKLIALYRHYLKQFLRIMKLTAVFLLAAVLQVSAKGFGQEKITISANNVPLEQVLNNIRSQTGYHFLYQEALIADKKVTIHVINATLKQTLDECLKNLKLVYNIVGKSIAIMSSDDKKVTIDNIIQSQNSLPFIDIKGRVVNENGQPVSDVTVTVKGTSRSTVTDLNGEFSLSTIDQNATLVFTHVSMETFELRVSGKTELAITLKTKIAALGDVQVVANTGYQQVKPNEVAGSLVVLDSKKLNEQTSPNILKRLEGVTPGLLFDNNKIKAGYNSTTNDNIIIRGLSTINASMDPLIVLDGFVYEGNINNINPNDIENITILKDAAASSIWGARAGNGVIVITTKKGKFNQKLRVSANADVIVSEKPDLYYLPQMSSKDYIDVEQLLFNNGEFDGLVAAQWFALTPVVEILNKRRNGQISSADSASGIDALKKVDIRDQYNKYVYRRAITQQYYLNFNGGNNTNAYNFSVGFDNGIGQLRDKNQKVNIKLENLFRPTKNLLVNIGAYYTSSKFVSGASGYNGGLTIGNRQKVVYLKLADDNGNPLPTSPFYRDIYTDTAGGGRLLDWKYYPLDEWKHNSTTNSIQEIFANIGAEYKLTKYLSIDIKGQYQRQQLQNDQLADIESFYARNLINSFTQLDRSTGVLTYIIPKGGIRTIGTGNVTSFTERAQLNFNHSWGDHHIVAIIGQEVRQVKNEGNQFTAYGYNGDPLVSTAVDFVNTYPTFVYGAYQGISGAPGFSSTVNRFVSTYGNASYTYKERYIFSASGRRDGSNIFGVHTNDKWKPLWSLGAGWIISNESFYKSAFVPLLKLRMSYGFSGNVDLSRSAVPVGNYGTAPYTNFPYTRVQTLNNPALRWEKSNMINLAVDFALVHQVISGSIEYYEKKGTDLYGPSLYDYTTWGYSNVITTNSSNMKGKGFDIVLNTRNIDKSFKWYTTILFNYNSNKVTKYYNSNSNPITAEIGSGGNGITPVVGKPVYAISAYKWGGLDASGNPQGYVNGHLSTNYDSIFNEASLKGIDGNVVYIGPSSPPFFGSISNTFSWKNFSLTALFTYKFGYYFQKNTISYSMLINNGIGHSDFEKRWIKPGDEATTTVPSFSYPSANNANRDNFYAASAVNILKADHIRLQYVNLSYSMPQNISKTLLLSDLQLYGNVSNVGIVWRANKDNLDPEFPTSLPPSRIWTFGIRANF